MYWDHSSLAIWQVYDWPQIEANCRNKYNGSRLSCSGENMPAQDCGAGPRLSRLNRDIGKFQMLKHTLGAKLRFPLLHGKG